MKPVPNSYFFSKLLAPLAVLATLGVVACSGMAGGGAVGGGGGLGPQVVNNADNSSLRHEGSVEEGTLGDEGLDPAWSNPVPAQEGQADSPDETETDDRLAVADPLNGGFADPDKAVGHGLKLYFKKMTVLCVDPPSHLIKIKMEGHAKTQDGDERVFRVVDKPTMQYLDTQTHQDEGGYVSFVMVTQPSLPLKFFILPKDYPIGALDTLLPCENGACIKEGKIPLKVYVFMMDPHYDPKHVTGPLCPRLDINLGNSSHTGSAKPGSLP